MNVLQRQRAAREVRERTGPSASESAKLAKRVAPPVTALDELAFEQGRRVDLRKAADRPSPVQPWVPQSPGVHRVLQVKTTCKHGHVLIDDQGKDTDLVLRVSGGGRRCRACRAARGIGEGAGCPRPAKATVRKNGHQLVDSHGQRPDYVRLRSDGRRFCLLCWRERVQLS